MTVVTDAGPKGTIFNLQRSSFHDGPGIRTTVFLKGCPLSCPWCHNPEGLDFAPGFAVTAARCLRCGACAAACPRDGGPLAAGGRLGVAGCLACLACAEACPTGSRAVVGRPLAVDELLAEVIRDRLAFDTSGGGVTFSGGEPLAQAQFLLACLDACRAAGLHTAVDTCGFAPREVALAAAARADLLLWDLKLLDPERHQAVVGVPLAPILANLAAVAAAGVPIWLRLPVIPGFNDDEDNLRAAARLAAATPGVARVSLLPYHPTGGAKAARLGGRDVMPVTSAPTPARMLELAAIVAGGGVETRIGG